MDKKTDWGKEILLAVVFIVAVIFIMNTYCGWKSKDRQTVEDFESKCRERGMELKYYIGYPDSDSIKIGCKRPDYIGFEELFVNAS